MKRIEDSLQISCVKWFRMQHPGSIITSLPTVKYSGTKTQRGKTGNRMKDMGYENGSPDLIIFHKSHTLFIELKTPKGKQSESQILFASKSYLNGFKYLVIRNVEDFIFHVNDFILSINELESLTKKT